MIQHTHTIAYDTTYTHNRIRHNIHTQLHDINTYTIVYMIHTIAYDTTYTHYMLLSLTDKFSYDFFIFYLFRQSYFSIKYYLKKRYIIYYII